MKVIINIHKRRIFSSFLWLSKVGSLLDKNTFVNIIFIYTKFILIIEYSTIALTRRWFNVYYPPTLMLLFAIIIIGAYVVHITMVITKQNKMIIKLTQELAIFKEKKDIEN